MSVIINLNFICASKDPRYCENFVSSYKISNPFLKNVLYLKVY